jgi:hypothetical protein
MASGTVQDLVCDICGEDDQDQLQECPDVCSSCITDAGLEGF